MERGQPSGGSLIHGQVVLSRSGSDARIVGAAGRASGVPRQRRAPLMKTTGNTILITGGTSGIGLGLALRLHELGNTVIVAGRRKELLDQITTEHPGIEALVLDVADPASIARARESVAASHPRLHVLVNNSD